MLKLTYDSKDQVPEKYLDLYTEKDGKYVLNQIEGMKTQADVDNVKTALQKERDLKKTAEAALAAYDGIEAEGLRASLDELAKLRTTDGKVDDTKIESIVAERLKLDKAKHERDLEALTGKLTTVTSERDNLVSDKNNSSIEAKLREAATGKVSESAMNDVLFRKSLFEVSEDGNVVTKDGVGVTPGQEPSAWLEDSLKSNTHWQKTSSGAGAKGNVGGSSTTPKDGRMTVREIVDSELTFK
jgi:copper chaperone CopZ